MSGYFQFGGFEFIPMLLKGNSEEFQIVFVNVFFLKCQNNVAINFPHDCIYLVVIPAYTDTHSNSLLVSTKVCFSE